METGDMLRVLAIAVGLGMLVGLQREHAESRIAGIRTFPLITLLGALSGLLLDRVGPWLAGAGLLGVIVATGLGNYIRGRTVAAGTPPLPGKTGFGMTTEIAILLMYAVGVFLAVGPAMVAICVTGLVVLLLHAKQWLHRFVENLGDRDVHGIMQFVLLACVILPVLPDKDMGPFGALNPRDTWLVVVLVAGISLGGYLLYRILGARTGTILAGVLGGLISSTATTVSFARRTKGAGGEAQGGDAAAALAIMLASTVLYGRIFIELSAVAHEALPRLAMPIGALALVSIVTCAVLFSSGRHRDQELPPQSNPTQLKSALVFALLYSLVSLAVAAAQQYVGAGGLYAVAAISGMTDMDAITLSSGRLVTDGKLEADTAWRVIVVAVVANLVFKAGVCVSFGSPHLRRLMLIAFGVNAAAGILLVLLWPAAG